MKYCRISNLGAFKIRAKHSLKSAQAPKGRRSTLKVSLLKKDKIFIFNLTFYNTHIIYANFTFNLC